MISDMMKCQYILRSLYASIGSTKTSANASLNNTNVSNNFADICTGDLKTYYVLYIDSYCWI